MNTAKNLKKTKSDLLRKRSAILWAALTLTALTSAAPIEARADGCRSWSAQTWMDQLQNLFQGVVPQNLDVASDDRQRRHKDTNWTTLAHIFGDDGCRARLADLGMLDSTQKMRDMVEEHRRSFDGGLGVEIPKGSYFKEAQNAFPGVWDLPTPFANGIPANWLQVCKDNGYSCMGKTNDNAYDPHFVMHVPKDPAKGQKYDQWFNVRPQGDPNSATPYVSGQMTVIQWNEQVIDADGAVSTSPRFTPFMAVRRARGAGQKLNELASAGRCLSCHSSGMIKPFRTIDDADLKAYADGDATKKAFDEEFKKTFRSYGSVAWNPPPEVPTARFSKRKGIYHPERMGPSFGTDKIDCASCHDGKRRGLINLANLGTYEHLAEDRIRDGSMPPGNVDPADTTDLKTQGFPLYQQKVWSWLTTVSP